MTVPPPPPLQDNPSLMQHYDRPRRRKLRAEERRQEYAQLLAEIAILERMLGITDEPPSGNVMVDGYRIPVPTRPDCGRWERR